MITNRCQQLLQDRLDRHEFVLGYIQAMLWANTLKLEGNYCGNDSWDAEMVPVDATRLREQLTWDALKELVRDAESFRRAEYVHLLAGARRYNWSEMGYCFALSRNGHGAGYFDRPIEGDVHDALQGAARVYGESTLELHSDGKIEVL